MLHQIRIVDDADSSSMSPVASAFLFLFLRDCEAADLASLRFRNMKQ